MCFRFEEETEALDVTAWHYLTELPGVTTTLSSSGLWSLQGLEPTVLIVFDLR